MLQQIQTQPIGEFADATVWVDEYFYIVDLGANVRLRHHRIGINAECTCVLGVTARQYKWSRNTWRKVASAPNGHHLDIIQWLQPSAPCVMLPCFSIYSFPHVNAGRAGCAFRVARAITGSTARISARCVVAWQRKERKRERLEKEPTPKGE
jgi:hypothetical protein